MSHKVGSHQLLVGTKTGIAVAAVGAHHREAIACHDVVHVLIANEADGQHRAIGLLHFQTVTLSRHCPC